MNDLSFHRLTLGLVLGILLSLAAAYYSQGRELAWLRRHHATAHQREVELKVENALLKQRQEINFRVTECPWSAFLPSAR